MNERAPHFKNDNIFCYSSSCRHDNEEVPLGAALSGTFIQILDDKEQEVSAGEGKVFIGIYSSVFESIQSVIVLKIPIHSVGHENSFL